MRIIFCNNIRLIENHRISRKYTPMQSMTIFFSKNCQKKNNKKEEKIKRSTSCAWMASI